MGKVVLNIHFTKESIQIENKNMERCSASLIVKKMQDKTEMKYCLVEWSTGFPSSSDSKESACSAGDLIWSLGQKDPLKKRMATPSSILAWRIPWTEEPSRLQFVGHKESEMTEQLTHTENGQ